MSSSPYPLCARSPERTRSVIDVSGVAIGGEAIVLMAGPCAVESREQVLAVAKAAKAAGAQLLRGGAYKPRTSPYDFQGMGQKGLACLDAARAATGLKVVTEAVSIESLACVTEVADLVQIGARNMQNFALLAAAGKQKKPVLLKRGLCATIREWLLAAEYIAHHGNPHIILCERGIRSFDTSTRNVLDVAAVPVVRSLCHLPIVIDPSHASGRRDCVRPLANAGIAAGADGLLIEVHPEPGKALCDGPQSLDLAHLAALGDDLRRIAPVFGRAYR